ncbi:unnamed protein product [Prorocentrum cordatum]|uniref:RING finger and CHY zinc finger domain-containing protein 1 n=1 Tax=Prorocentrum cordatum TaxID=2364126 RepID=A0ABN9UDP6_9DINO|nr:unnamed protein product [Polarella glacialis]
MATGAPAAAISASQLDRLAAPPTFASQDPAHTTGRSKGGKGGFIPRRRTEDAWTNDDYLRQICRDEFDSMRASFTETVGAAVGKTVANSHDALCLRTQVTAQSTSMDQQQEQAAIRPQGNRLDHHGAEWVRMRSELDEFHKFPAVADQRPVAPVAVPNGFHRDPGDTGLVAVAQRATTREAASKAMSDYLSKLSSTPEECMTEARGQAPTERFEMQLHGMVGQAARKVFRPLPNLKQGGSWREFTAAAPGSDAGARLPRQAPRAGQDGVILRRCRAAVADAIPGNIERYSDRERGILSIGWDRVLRVEVRPGDYPSSLFWNPDRLSKHGHSKDALAQATAAIAAPQRLAAVHGDSNFSSKDALTLGETISIDAVDWAHARQAPRGDASAALQALLARNLLGERALVLPTGSGCLGRATPVAAPSRASGAPYFDATSGLDAPELDARARQLPLTPPLSRDPPPSFPLDFRRAFPPLGQELVFFILRHLGAPEPFVTSANSAVLEIDANTDIGVGGLVPACAGDAGGVAARVAGLSQGVRAVSRSGPPGSQGRALGTLASKALYLDLWKSGPFVATPAAAGAGDALHPLASEGHAATRLPLPSSPCCAACRAGSSFLPVLARSGLVPHSRPARGFLAAARSRHHAPKTFDDWPLADEPTSLPRVGGPSLRAHGPAETAHSAGALGRAAAASFVDLPDFFDRDGLPDDDILPLRARPLRRMWLRVDEGAAEMSVTPHGVNKLFTAWRPRALPGATGELPGTADPPTEAWEGAGGEASPAALQCWQCRSICFHGQDSIEWRTVADSVAIDGGGSAGGRAAHELDRALVREVLCHRCGARQPAGEACQQCGEVFGAYFCGACNFWDDEGPQKAVFHCAQCGICRVGGRENFFHCDTCGSCYPNEIRDTHVCVENAMRQNCPVCLGDLFQSTSQVTILTCGHTIHQDCLRELQMSCAGLQSLRCPLCSASLYRYDELWAEMDKQIADTPMPMEYQKTACGIVCNDCQQSSSVPFHVLGHKCPVCSSYNTRRA